MSDTTEDPGRTVGESIAPASPDAGRRRVLQGGLAVTPVVLTLASRSAFAGRSTTGLACTTPSGFVSGNTSTPGAPGTCLGYSPGYWWSKPHVTWPLPFVRTNPFYGTSFGGNLFASGSYINYSTLSNPNPTMMDVMSAHQGGNDPSTLGFHIIAALLNQASGLLPPFITAAMLFDMFNQVATKGYFLPMPSQPLIQWSAGDVVNYLIATGITDAV